jgi:hypothetical protein
MARPRKAQFYKLRSTPNTFGLIGVAAKRNLLLSCRVSLGRRGGLEYHDGPI